MIELIDRGQWNFWVAFGKFGGGGAVACNDVPHLPQNRFVSLLGVPQFGQFIVIIL